ncbi:hypothetical protein [uncultured Faecalibaculum sp.]|uniref:hypothetical protein n=1 Tax=uncultured Faecalibaculum sp. TaxID=1729681 RepID=UPI0025EA42D1|nr:hypothetical protein [uncultured Faecalibaculum sp.]
MKVKEQYANSVNITTSGPDVIFSYYKETPEIEDEKASKELVGRIRVSLPIAMATVNMFQQMMTQMPSVQEESENAIE